MSQRKITLIFFSLFIFCLFNKISIAQSDKNAVDPKNDTNAVEQKDIKDVLKKVFGVRHRLPSTDTVSHDSSFVFDPGAHPLLASDSSKVKHGKLLFAPIPAIGYTLVTGTTAVLAMNLSFYSGSKSNTNLSAIAVNPILSLAHHQFLLPAVFNLWSPDNKLNFVGDWRYYIYPTYTYGLGGHSKITDADLVDYNYARVYQQVLKHIGSNFYTGLGYNLDYHWGIEEEGSQPFFQQYNNNATKTISSGLSASLIYDTRTNINNPERAFYGGLTYRSNFTFLGSDQNWQSVYLEFKKYFKLAPHTHQVLALWSLNWFTFGGKVPYFDLPSMGWDSYSNTGRGYIQGRLRGPGMVYLEAEYRFDILRNGLLGGVLFSNVSSVSELESKKFETVLPGYGFGIRIKANKRSNVNLAIDYGFGLGGSQGLAFNVSEIF